MWPKQIANHSFAYSLIQSTPTEPNNTGSRLADGEKDATRAENANDEPGLQSTPAEPTNTGSRLADGDKDATSPENTIDGPGLQPMDTSEHETSSPAPIPEIQSHAPEIIAMIASIKGTLSTTFSTAPPHTVQRLAELLQKPNQHYHSLPKFLRAVQRVISVSSTIDQFPLVAAVDVPTTGMLNLLGSDESLGGALLTPISWLRTSIEGDFDTRMNGVSQEGFPGQENEMGSQALNSTSNGDNDEHRQVHEGPSTIGPEDLGPQPPGIVFDLNDPPSESVVVLESNTRANHMDTQMSSDDGATTSPQMVRETEDMMDVDEKINEEKEPLNPMSSSEDTTQGKQCIFASE